jgi:hypothetical protein
MTVPSRTPKPVQNPWLQIPLDELEGHLALPHVAQAQLLADVFEDLLKRYSPESLAVLGCAGGNGFERIATDVTKRVVGADLNPEYIERLRARFQDHLPGLETFVGDIQTESITFAPVDLVFAALLFEYVDVDLVLQRIRSLLKAGGLLGTVVQLPQATSPAVTPSPFASLQALAAILQLVPPERLRSRAQAHGYEEIESRWVESPAGKRFQVQVFRRLPEET